MQYCQKKIVIWQICNLCSTHFEIFVHKVHKCHRFDFCRFDFFVDFFLYFFSVSICFFG